MNLERQSIKTNYRDKVFEKPVTLKHFFLGPGSHPNMHGLH